MADAGADPEVTEQGRKAKKRVQSVMDQNKRARDIDEMDARTEDIVHAYSDSFYRDTVRDDPDDPTVVQSNYLKPWADTYLAALSYGRFTPSVLPSPQRPSIPGMNEPIRRLLDQWLNTQRLAEKIRRAAQVSLLEGEAALYLDIDWDIAAESPMDAIGVGVVTRRDLLIDRQSKQSRAAYLGMLLEKPPNGWKDHEPSDEEGSTPTDRIPRRKTYLYLYDLDRSIPVSESQGGPSRYKAQEQDDGNEDDDDTPDEDLGIYVCACVQQQHGNDAKYDVKKVEDVAPIIYVDPFGRPIAPIVPILLTPHPDYPQRGMPAALTPYNLVAPRNILRSWQLQSGRFDMSRIRSLDPARVNQEAGDGIDTGDLCATVWLNPSDPSKPAPTLPPIAYYAPPPVPDTIKVLEAGLDSDTQKTSGVSPLLMGQMQGKGYSTATESEKAAAYSEASIAPLKTLLNTKCCDLAQVFLSVLAATCHNVGATGVMLLEADGVTTTEIPVEAMLYPWNITMDDTASTPMADQQQMTLWAQVDPILRQTLMDYMAAQGGQTEDPESGLPVAVPGNPMLMIYLEQSYKRYHQLWRLPETLSWDAMIAKRTAQTQAPPGVGAPVDPTAGQMPVDAGMPAELPIPPDVTGIMEQQHADQRS